MATHARRSHSETRTPGPGTALLVLDMVNRFDFEGGRALGATARVIAPRIAALRGRFDAAGAPTLYVNDNFSHWQGGFADLVASCRDAGGAPGAIVQRLAPRPHDYHVLKPKHSGFLATPLAILLAKLGVRRLVITGVAADACVLATAQDAKMREYALWTPRDCLAAMSPARIHTALALLSRTLGADVRATRSVAGLFPG